MRVRCLLLDACRIQLLCLRRRVRQSKHWVTCVACACEASVAQGLSIVYRADGPCHLHSTTMQTCDTLVRVCCSWVPANVASRQLIDQTDTPIYSGEFVGNWSWLALGAANIASYSQTGVGKAAGLCLTLTNPGVSIHGMYRSLAYLSVWNRQIFTRCTCKLN